MSDLKTDEYWVERYLAGDAGAFDHLVESTQNRLFASILRIVGSRDETLDVLQDTYLKVFRNIHRFQRGCSFYTWVYRISVNQAISYRRKKRLPSLSFGWRGDNSGEQDMDPTDPDSAESPLEKLLVEERNVFIERALNALPPAQRAVLVMCDFDGLKYDEIADVLGVPIGTVRSRIHRAREELRKKLEPFLEIDPETGRDLVKPRPVMRTYGIGLGSDELLEES